MPWRNVGGQWRSRGGVWNGVGATWTPAELFAAGGNGVWYDPGDLSTMWQETARTMPAGVSDPVASLSDLSGAGNHAVMATSSRRPILREDAMGRKYLDFDGVEDALAFANFIFGSAPHSCVIAASTAPGPQYVFEVGSDATLQRRTLSTEILMGYFAANQRYEPEVSGSNVLTSVYPAGSSRADAHRVWVNGAHRPATAGANPGNTVQTAGEGAWLGSGSGRINGTAVTVAGNMDLYGFVLIDRELSAVERGQLEAFMAAKIGVTLSA